MSNKDKKGDRNNGLLTPMQNRFVEHFDGNATEAARKAGYKSPNKMGPRLMKDPAVRAAVEVKMQLKLEAQAKEEGKRIGKAKGLERAEHLEILATIARDETQAAADRIRAVMGSAELKHMRISRLADVSNEFEGRTEQELEYYAAHGYWPDKESVDSGQPGPS